MCLKLFRKACTGPVLGICAMNGWMSVNGGVNVSGSLSIPGYPIHLSWNELTVEELILIHKGPISHPADIYPGDLGELTSPTSLLTV